MPKLSQRLSGKPKLFFLSIYTLILLGFLLIGFWAGMAYGDLFGLRGPVVTPTPTPDKYIVSPISKSPEGVACSADALQCPDGSYVGRTGPNCQFVCPQ